MLSWSYLWRTCTNYGISSHPVSRRSWQWWRVNKTQRWACATSFWPKSSNCIVWRNNSSTTSPMWDLTNYNHRKCSGSYPIVFSLTSCPPGCASWKPQRYVIIMTSRVFSSWRLKSNGNTTVCSIICSDQSKHQNSALFPLLWRESADRWISLRNCQ